MASNLTLQGYFRHNDMNYRVQIFYDGSVWVERQTPRAFNGNLPMGNIADEIVYGSETWRLDAISYLLDRYEREYAGSE
jgi:hypothetical protein